MKFPLGIQSFRQIREDGYVYVDKTDMVYSLVHEGKTYFLSRPRRFGKSLLVSTLEAYFLGHKELFKGLKIYSMETEWKTHPVFHLSFGGQNFSEPYTLKAVLEEFVSMREKEYGRNELAITLESRFRSVIKNAYDKTGQRVAVLIDEYDKPLLDVMSSNVNVTLEGGSSMNIEKYNRELLKGFYSVFKEADDYLQFVFLTGVTKFSQVSVFSGFNQPDDISMTSRYETICGITEEEMKESLTGPIEDMGKVYGCGFDRMVQILRKQYDGYHFSKSMAGVYNPFSLLKALKYSDIADYWFQTGTPEYLSRLLISSNENLDEVAGKYYPSSQFIDYEANKEMPLPMIYQSGYLTIKDYRPRTDTFLLDFPNNEVKRGFTALLAGNYLKSREDTKSFIAASVDELYDGNIECFISGLKSFFASIPYSMHLKKDKERFFHYTFYLLLRLASTYVTYTEKQQSQGRVDCVIETDRFIYIIEFKLDGTAEEALQQIEDKGYTAKYATDGRKLFKIGINFSSQTGTISDWKVAE